MAFRLIKPEWVRPDGQRPTSQAFQDHRRSEAMSVYLEDEIHVGGHGILPIDGQLISPLAVTKAPH